VLRRNSGGCLHGSGAAEASGPAPSAERLLALLIRSAPLPKLCHRQARLKLDSVHWDVAPLTMERPSSPAACSNSELPRPVLWFVANQAHQDPASGARYMFPGRALVSCHRCPVDSNVRSRQKSTNGNSRVFPAIWLQYPKGSGVADRRKRGKARRPFGMCNGARHFCWASSRAGLGCDHSEHWDRQDRS
jgi:hypothetical protein